jgi:predicted RNase H-like nuclease/CBS domain-containing protein
MESFRSHVGDHEIADSIQARHLQVWLGDALILTPDEPAVAASRRLAERNFDRAPVGVDGRLIGVAERARLAAAPDSVVADVSERIDPALLVSADAPVALLLGWLATTEFLFVLDGHAITGFVTAGDLNKQPGRTYFFLLLADVEMRLADLVRHRHRGPPAELLALLVDERAEEVRDQHAAAQAADREPDVVAYFNLADLLRVVARDPDLLGVLGLPSRQAWKALTSSFPELRNAVVHGVRDLVDGQRGPSELLRADGRLRETLDRVIGAEAALRDTLVDGSPLVATSSSPPLRLAGVDGSRGGWIVALELAAGEVRLESARSISDLLRLELDLIAIDMPIGLRDGPPGARAVDSAARAHLQARRSSVFNAPDRGTFLLSGWDDPRRPAHGLSRQSLAIMPKIRELDEAASTGRQWRGQVGPSGPAFAEIHPEVSFTELNGGVPLAHPKRTSDGAAARVSLLRSVFPTADSLIADRPHGVALDDALDALVALWTARRLAAGTAIRLGGEVDSRGLERVIWA